MSKLPNKDKEKPVIKSKNPEKIEKKPIVQEIKPADDQKIIQKNIKKKLLNSYNHIPRFFFHLFNKFLNNFTFFNIKET